jgi:hypothetical protein
LNGVHANVGNFVSGETEGPAMTWRFIFVADPRSFRSGNEVMKRQQGPKDVKQKAKRYNGNVEVDQQGDNGRPGDIQHVPVCDPDPRRTRGNGLVGGGCRWVALGRCPDPRTGITRIFDFLFPRYGTHGNF